MRWHCRYLLAVALTVSTAYALAAGPGDWRGERLVDLLAALDQQGARIIYSSDLVSDEYRLEVEPDLSDLRSGLQQAVAGFGLAVVDGPGRSLLIVRGTTTAQSVLPPPAVDPEPPLPEIIVTSSLRRLENVHAEAHTYLDRELAGRIPTTADEVVRLIDRLPGTANGGLSARSHVRGGEANEVLFLLDGLRLYQPYHLKDFQSIATIVSSNSIDGLEMYSGAFPARFGDRMSGVMDLRLRQPGARRETELGLSFFNTSVFSMGTIGAGNQGDWLVSARRGNLDIVADVVDPDFGSPRYNDVLLRGGWVFGPRAETSLGYITSTDKIALFDADQGEAARARNTNEATWLKWSAQWNERLRSETIIAHSSIDNARRGSLNLPGIVSGSLEEASEFRITSFKQDWTYTPGKVAVLRFGFDAKHLDGSFDFASSREVLPPFAGLFAADAVVDNEAEIVSDGGQYAVYADTRWRLGGNLIVDAGLRWDQQLYTLASGDTQTSPRLNLLYRLGERSELRLGWGQFSQAQEVNELQVSDGVYDYFPAQRAEHVVLQYERSLRGDMELELSVYRKSFRKLRPRFENALNLRTLVSELQFDRYRIDARQAESRGAEALLSAQSRSGDLFWWLGYAWSSVEDQVDGGDLRRSWDQTHTGKAGLSWQWRSWNFSAAAQVHTGWPRTELVATPVANPDGSTTLAVEPTPINSLRHDTFHTLDVRVSRRFPIGRGELNAFLDVTNIYDRPNPCCIEYSVDNDGNPAALRSREAHWLPLVPSLGIVWKF